MLILTEKQGLHVNRISYGCAVLKRLKNLFMFLSFLIIYHQENANVFQHQTIKKAITRIQ